MSHENASVKSIVFALLANFGIAVTKSVAAFITGSGAMLAEAIHSFADCGNQGLLFLGLKVSKKAPDNEHPLGYGKAIYFWSFIVALILFSMGGLFSIYEGIHKLSLHEGLKKPMVAIVVLSVSIILEAASLFGCITQINKVKGKQSIWKWLINSRQSELVVVFGEDIAALFGLTFALFAVVMAIITGNPDYDAIGSIGIGVLLILISLLLAAKVKRLLIGQSADTDMKRQINDFIAQRDEVEEVLNLITIQLGPKVMVAAKVKMKDTDSISALEMIGLINQCEKDLRKAFTEIQWIFFEPDVEK